MFTSLGCDKQLPSRELTYPTLEKRKSSWKCHILGDMLVPWRVSNKDIQRQALRIMKDPPFKKTGVTLFFVCRVRNWISKTPVTWDPMILRGGTHTRTQNLTKMNTRIKTYRSINKLNKHKTYYEIIYSRFLSLWIIIYQLPKGPGLQKQYKQQKYPLVK